MVCKQLNIAKFTESGCHFPLHSFMVPFECEIAAFRKKLWDLVLKKLLILIAILLELPEQYSVETNMKNLVVTISATYANIPISF